MLEFRKILVTINLSSPLIYRAVFHKSKDRPSPYLPSSQETSQIFKPMTKTCVGIPTYIHTCLFCSKTIHLYIEPFGTSPKIAQPTSPTPDLTFKRDKTSDISAWLPENCCADL